MEKEANYCKYGIIIELQIFHVATLFQPSLMPLPQLQKLGK
jgi:hypothetical protein